MHLFRLKEFYLNIQKFYLNHKEKIIANQYGLAMLSVTVILNIKVIGGKKSPSLKDYYEETEPYLSTIR